MFEGPFSESVLGRAQDKGIVEIVIRNIRDYATDRHRTVDDYPYGGGAGMVMKPEPLFAAVEAVRKEIASGTEEGATEDGPIILLTPQGRLFSQKSAVTLAAEKELILICGHYGGVDERIREHLATDEISIGDYVLSGGELAAMVIVDAVVRLVPGVLGSEESALGDSHMSGLLQHPLYTRPQSFRGWDVPQPLLSGNHAQIARWRREQSILRTLKRRPDLLENALFSPQEKRMVEEMRRDASK